MVEHETLFDKRVADPGRPVGQAVDMYRAIPQAELAVVPGADHFLIWSKGELLARLMLDFLLRYSTPS